MFKELLRHILLYLKLDLTKNLKYDRLTHAVIKKAVYPGAICVDVGCHKGEILDLFIKQSPNGKHFGFEPIPSFYRELIAKYPNHNIFNYALSNEEGEASFNYVKNAPAYSGLKNRTYSIEHPEIEKITVPLKRLDDIVQEKIAFIKIDVEGAEMLVLKGAKNLLNTSRPVVIFECGLGASDFYQTSPQDVYDFFDKEIGYHLSLMDKWLKKEMPLSREAFLNLYHTNSEYYFIGYSK